MTAMRNRFVETQRSAFSRRVSVGLLEWERANVGDATVDVEMRIDVERFMAQLSPAEPGMLYAIANLGEIAEANGLSRSQVYRRLESHRRELPGYQRRSD